MRAMSPPPPLAGSSATRSMRTERWTNIAGSPFAAGSGTISVAVGSSSKFVYATGSTANTVSAYASDSVTGALTVVGSPIPTGTTPRR